MLEDPQFLKSFLYAIPFYYLKRFAPNVKTVLWIGIVLTLIRIRLPFDSDPDPTHGKADQFGQLIRSDRTRIRNTTKKLLRDQLRYSEKYLRVMN